MEWIEVRGNKVALYRDGTPPKLDREVPLEDFLREVTALVRRPGHRHHLLLPPGFAKRNKVEAERVRMAF